MDRDLKRQKILRNAFFVGALLLGVVGVFQLLAANYVVFVFDMVGAIVACMAGRSVNNDLNHNIRARAEWRNQNK